MINRFCTTLLAITFASIGLLVVPLVSAEAKTAKPTQKMKIKYFDFEQNNGQPSQYAVSPGKTLPTCNPNIYSNLYAFIEYKGIARKSPVVAEWQEDGEVIYRNAFKWNYRNKVKGAFATSVSRNVGQLQDGLYKLTIRVNKKSLASARVTIQTVTC